MEEHLNKLTIILQKLNIPFYRLTLNKNNLMWLSKNLKKKNSKHVNYNEAQSLVDYCLTNHLYKS